MIFFECRLEQLTSELSQANAEVERLKADLAGAAEREVALKQQVATAERRAAQAIRERNEAQERTAVARGERERILDKLIEAERVRQAGSQGEEMDLAGFIAELRAEVLELRALQAPGAARPGDAGSPSVPAAIALRTGAFSSTEQAAEKLASAGRIGITDGDRETLRTAAHFETRTEETLFALSLRELSAPDATSRLRAAQRLKALGPRAALPAVAAALNAEPARDVTCALLAVVAAAADATVLPLVEPFLHADTIEVRLAALEAAVALKREDALADALSDASCLVRRRAAVLAAGRADGLPTLLRAVSDEDASVRRVAVLGLGDVSDERARSALLVALDDADPTVRRAAAKGLSRSHGPEVFVIADLDTSHRRRELRRLANQPPGSAATVTAPPPAARAPATPATPAAPAAAAVVAPAAAMVPAAAPQQAARVAGSSPTAAIRAMSAPARPAAPSGGIESEVLAKIYAALRGLSEEELARGLAQEPGKVREAAVALVGSGRLVRRGQRYFVP